MHCDHVRPHRGIRWTGKLVCLVGAHQTAKTQQLTAKPTGRGPESQPDKAWSARVWCEDRPYPGSTLPHKPTPPLAWVFHAPQRQGLPWKGKDKHKPWFLSPRGMVAKKQASPQTGVRKQEQHWRTEGRPAFGSHTTDKRAVCPHQQILVGTDEETLLGPKQPQDSKNVRLGPGKKGGG